jgi:phospholipase D1/2
MQTEDRSTLNDAPIIYVHSKVSIFDDTEAIVSSANLNGRSLRWDTEAGVHLTRPDHVRQVTRRIWSHWMPGSPQPSSASARAIADSWRATIEHDRHSGPCARRSYLLPYDEAEAASLGENVPIVPNELV